MEVFVDFGLFEVIAELGIAAVAKRVYSARSLTAIVLCASLAFPGLLLFLSDGEMVRWLAAGTLATALINLSVVLGALQEGHVPTLTLTRTRSRADGAR